MRIVGHGVDLVEVARIERMIAEHGERFLSRCFTDGERAYADRASRRRAEHYAGRFACKEAVLKALGTGWRDGISWTDMEIIREPSGRPTLVLAGRCREIASEAGIDSWAISLSHTDSHAIGSAIAAASE